MNELIETAKTAARAAGAEIMRHYESGEFEIKADGTPVTLADRCAHDLLCSLLAPTGIPVLSEESDDRPSFPYPERLWIIDPLDGTKGFIEKNGDFSVLIGLLELGRPVLGIIFAPAYGTLYLGSPKNAFMEKDGMRSMLTVSSRTEELRCLRSVHHVTPRMESVISLLGARTFPRGSNGIKAGALTEQEGDFFFSFGRLGEWDVCATEALVTAAGGSVTDTEGNLIHYGNKDYRIQKGVVFSNGAAHERILQAVLGTT